MITSFKNGAHDERSYFFDHTTNCNSGKLLGRHLLILEDNVTTNIFRSTPLNSRK